MVQWNNILLWFVCSIMGFFISSIISIFSFLSLLIAIDLIQSRLSENPLLRYDIRVSTHLNSSLIDHPISLHHYCIHSSSFLIEISSSLTVTWVLLTKLSSIIVIMHLYSIWDMITCVFIVTICISPYHLGLNDHRERAVFSIRIGNTMLIMWTQRQCIIKGDWKRKKCSVISWLKPTIVVYNTEDMVER